MRFAGRQVRVTTNAPQAGRRHFAGRLVGLEDATVHLVLADGQEIGIPKDQIAKARLVADHEQVGSHLAGRGRHA
jgi:ribosome maturation factor RimP